MEPRIMESRALGDYTIIKQIGQGSLGIVYLAEHRFMKKQFVLKALPEELATDRSFIQRFEEEVGTLATLDHPHIVKIHNISFQQGQYFLVTDCVVDEMGETTNLAQYLISRGRKLDEETLYRLLMQIAEALDFAHGRRTSGKAILHRNLKLNNILVSKGRGGIDVLISDFGLSRIVGTGAVLTRSYRIVAEALGVSLSKTAPERYPNPPHDVQKLIPLHASFLQNFAFLAPEQKRLDSPYPVDAKSDVYAFGILAYYLLMGEFPDGLFEMPSAKASDYHWNWDHLIRLCLHSDPRKRPEFLVPVLEMVRSGLRMPVEPSNSLHYNYAPPPPAAAVPNPMAERIIEKTVYQAPPTPVPVYAQPEPAYVQQQAAPVPAPVQVQAPAPMAARAPEPVEIRAPEPVVEQQMVPQALAASSLRPVLMSTKLERPVTDPDPGAVFQIDTTVKHYVPERKEVSNIQPLLTEMVVVEGGSFWRGSGDGNRDESPRHQITLSNFAIDIHPVTNDQFVRFLEVMGGEKDSNHQDIIRLRDSRIKRSGGKLSIESGYSKHPVVGVTWYGAVAYAKWIGKRLPTEGEWEIAARGGLENAYFPTGDDIEKSEANFFSSDTTAVMSYAPNGYGLFDMAGNVYQWCHDWYGYNYYEASVQEPENPPGPLQGVYRVLRGGCWKSLKEDMRCSRRHRNNPGTVNSTYGFRCAADVKED